MYSNVFKIYELSSARHSATFETESSYCRVARQRLQNVFGTHVFLYVLVELAEAQKLGKARMQEPITWKSRNYRLFTNLMI